MFTSIWSWRPRPRALRVALEYRPDLAPGAPIVFLAVDAARDLELPPDVTGVLLTFDWMDTLGAALRLQPETRRVVVVGGTAAYDKRVLAAARAAFAGAPAQLEFTYVTDLPLEAVAAKLAALPDGTIVFLASFLRDGAGRNLSMPEALDRLVEMSRVPIYGIFGTLMGHGIVGGRLIDFEMQGLRAGELGLRLLRGEKLGPADIVTQNTNTYAFDWRAAQALGAQGGSAASGQRDPLPGAVGVGAVPVADHRNAGPGPARVSADRRPGGPAGAAEARGGRGGRAARAARPRPAGHGHG